MQASVHQEENREADKLRRFRICGNVSKHAGMSSGALIKKNNPKTLCISMLEWRTLELFYFRKYPLKGRRLSQKARLSEIVNVTKYQNSTCKKSSFVISLHLIVNVGQNLTNVSNDCHIISQTHWQLNQTLELWSARKHGSSTEIDVAGSRHHRSAANDRRLTANPHLL